MRTNRLEAFSDGVFAIAITLLAVELPPAAAVALAFVLPAASLALCFCVAAFFLLPDRANQLP